jgi:hypothetical protein
VKEGGQAPGSVNANLKIAPSRSEPIIDLNDLIPVAEGATMLGLDASTIRKRKAGTENLALIRQGRNLFLVRGEIIAHRAKLIDDARHQNNVLRLVSK